MSDLLTNLTMAAGAAGEENLYIEDVFSTYLYTGNGSTQTITNGIDLDGEGGLVWIKNRDQTDSHILTDTERGATDILSSDSTAAEATDADTLTAFNSDGFALGADVKVNTSTERYASWSFRKAPKFFDIVTYTGNGTTQVINHNLGSDPGVIIAKRATGGTGAWRVYHRSIPGTALTLNSAGQIYPNENSVWGNDVTTVNPTSTEFTVGSDINANSATYVAYLFAHDAGGFGDDGSENVITCGSYTGNGSSNGPTVTLGYEPQWLMVKCSSNDGGGDPSNWWIIDNMRGWLYEGNNVTYLEANTTAAELIRDRINLTSTGFKLTASFTPWNGSGETYIYIAIRRGPMKTPTAGTEVFNPVVYTGTNVDNRLVNTSLLTDMVMIKERNDTVDGMVTGDRLRGNPYLLTGTTAAENADADTYMTPTSGVGNAFSAMNGVGVGNDGTSKVNIDTTANNQVAWAFRRAPKFFDVVCYTATGSALTVNHNLGVIPEIILFKKRDGTGPWVFMLDFAASDFYQLNLEENSAGETRNYGLFLDSKPTATSFEDAGTYTGEFVAYLFASLPGISKVGSYTGNGTSVTITTGFQPRFILVKRTSATGNWVVGDSARGLVAGDDPFIELNVNTGETTNEDWVDITSSSFTINETTENLNVNAATYIYLAIS